MSFYNSRFIYFQTDTEGMDVVLNYADEYVLTPYVYPTSWLEENPIRQIISLLLITNLGGYALYFIFAALSYQFIFDKRLMKHPLILEVI